MLRVLRLSGWPKGFKSPLVAATARRHTINVSVTARWTSTSSNGEESATPSFAEGLSSLAVPIVADQQRIPPSDLPRNRRSRRARSRRPSGNQPNQAALGLLPPARPARPARLSRRSTRRANKAKGRTEKASHSFGKRQDRVAAASDGQPDYDPKELDEAVENTLKPEYAAELPPDGAETLVSGRIQADEVKITEVVPLRQMKVARLDHGLQRVLFSPGVHPFRDLRSGVWNFPSDFVKIPKPEEYAFDRSPRYITPSQDEELLTLAKREECRFIGSTSTLTQAFSQLYFAISGGKGVDLSTLSQSFTSERSDFTSGAELPACLTLGPLQDGRYYVDSDKQYDTENILSEYGVILEKILVSSRQDFKRFLKSSPPELVTEEERNEKEAYRYSKYGSLMMRSQLDCQDDRLPGSGVFDIKTRACLPIRHDRANYEANSAYTILKDKGSKLSFEKEYYDIVRAGMLKWSMQARIGGMDGIFVAYHNTKTLLGFQYLPMSEIDERLFGSSAMGTQAFHLVVSLFDALIGHCADLFPGQETSIVIHRSPSRPKVVTAYVTPVGEGEQPVRAIHMSTSSFMNGRRIARLLDFDTSEPQAWSVGYTISKSGADEESIKTARQEMENAIRKVKGISTLSVPEGKTVEEMSISHPQSKWRNPDKRVLDLREEAKQSLVEYQKLKSAFKNGAVAWTRSR